MTLLILISASLLEKNKKARGINMRKTKKILFEFFKEIHYWVYCLINHLVPKDKKRIFIYDSSFLRQNCWALVNYLSANGYTNKYKVYYFSNRTFISNLDGDIKNNVFFVSSFFQGWWNHLRSKYTFYEYDNNKFCSSSANGQINFNLWHGMPLKRIGYLSNRRFLHKPSRDFNYVLAISPLFADVMKKCFKCKEEQIYIGGNPRNDYLLHKSNTYSFFNCKDVKAVWMPTFRKSTLNSFEDSSCVFPILNKQNIKSFNSFLEKNHIKILIKLHPFQDKIDWLFSNDYSNIKAIFNSDLFKEKIELYELLRDADTLITDYSSVYMDYLLIDKPIIFAFDDFNDYKNTRGFVFDRIEDFLPGDVVHDLNGLEKSLLSSDTLEHRNKRKEINNVFNSCKSDFCYNLLSFVGIEK